MKFKVQIKLTINFWNPKIIFFDELFEIYFYFFLIFRKNSQHSKIILQSLSFMRRRLQIKIQFFLSLTNKKMLYSNTKTGKTRYLQNIFHGQINFFWKVSPHKPRKNAAVFCFANSAPGFYLVYSWLNPPFTLSEIFRPYY